MERKYPKPYTISTDSSNQSADTKIPLIDPLIIIIRLSKGCGGGDDDSDHDDRVDAIGLQKTKIETSERLFHNFGYFTASNKTN